MDTNQLASHIHVARRAASNFCRRNKVPHWLHDEYEGKAMVFLVKALREFETSGFENIDVFIRVSVRGDLFDSWASHFTKGRATTTLHSMPDDDDSWHPHAHMETENIDLVRMLKALRPKRRKIVEMRYFEDHSMDEIGRRLNMAKATVIREVARAHKQMADYAKKVPREKLGRMVQ